MEKSFPARKMAFPLMENSYASFFSDFLGIAYKLYCSPPSPDRCGKTKASSKGDCCPQDAASPSGGAGASSSSFWQRRLGVDPRALEVDRIHLCLGKRTLGKSATGEENLGVWTLGTARKRLDLD